MINKHTEYLAPLGSMARNTTRRALVHLGRYHGFDTIAAGVGSNIPIKVSHTEIVEYVDDTNAKVSAAVFVTGHGVVVVTDEEPTVELLANTSGAIQYQVLYAQYTWASVTGGSSVSYGADGVTGTEPTSPPSMVATKTPLGYFTVQDGASAITGVSYTPYAVPNLANKPDLDLAAYAVLAGNEFTGINVNSYASLPKEAVVVDSTLGAPWSKIVLSEDVNVYHIAALDAGTYKVYNIEFTSGRVPVNGEVLVIKFPPSASTIKFYGGGNISVLNDLAETSLAHDSVFQFIYIDGLYLPLSFPTTLMLNLRSITSRVSTLEEESKNYEGRISILESSAISWTNIISPGTNMGVWTIDSLQVTAESAGLRYIRGKFTISDAGSAAGVVDLVSYVLGANVTLYAPNHSAGSSGLQDGISIRLNNGDDSIKLITPLIASGDIRSYTLPTTPLT